MNLRDERTGSYHKEALVSRMKEQDYIAVTDLARLRIAKQPIVETLPQTENEKSNRDQVVRALSRWIELLERKVKKINITE